MEGGPTKSHITHGRWLCALCCPDDGHIVNRPRLFFSFPRLYTHPRESLSKFFPLSLSRGSFGWTPPPPPNHKLFVGRGLLFKLFDDLGRPAGDPAAAVNPARAKAKKNGA